MTYLTVLQLPRLSTQDNLSAGAQKLCDKSSCHGHLGLQPTWSESTCPVDTQRPLSIKRNHIMCLIQE